MNENKNNEIFSPLLLKKRCYHCGIEYNDEHYLTKNQVAELFEIDEKIIDWYIEDNIGELRKNGYKVLNSEEIKNIKNLNNLSSHVSDSDRFEIFSVETILNISMLMYHSPNASIIRKNILEIVMQNLSSIDISKLDINLYDKENLQKKGDIGDFLENKTYNDKNIKRYIFKLIFEKKADDYCKTLNIQYQDSIRANMNLEITNLIDKYFDLLLEEVKELSEKENCVLSEEKFKNILKNSLNNQRYIPLINELKSLIANRNIIFMNAFYKKIKNFPLTINDDEIDEYIDKKCKKIQDKFLKGENFQVLINLQNR